MGLFTFVDMQSKRIFLIGFMGVGKTTIGKKLSDSSGLPFIDVDHEIEKLFDLSINSIFEKFGEAFFRKEETKMLEKIASENSQAIISVGGGLPCYNKNMELMNRVGLTCYMHRSTDELHQRLKNSTHERPLLRGLDDEQLKQFIEDKLLEREVYYNQAKIKVRSTEQEVEQMMVVLNLEFLNN